MVTAPGPDPEPFVQAVRAYEEAGFDEVYPGRVGGRLDGAFEFFATQVAAAGAGELATLYVRDP